MNQIRASAGAAGTGASSNPAGDVGAGHAAADPEAQDAKWVGRPPGAAPVIGEWYRRCDRPEAFHVTAFDESSGEIDVEYRDGTLDEWPLAHWRELRCEAVAPPQDWRGPLDCGSSGAEGEDPPEPDAAALLEPIEAAGDEAERELLERLADDIAKLRRRHPARTRPGR